MLHVVANEYPSGADLSSDIPGLGGCLGRTDELRHRVELLYGACEVHWNRRVSEGQHTTDTDAPLARLVGHFTNTRAQGPAHVFAQRLIETS